MRNTQQVNILLQPRHWYETMRAVAGVSDTGIAQQPLVSTVPICLLIILHQITLAALASHARIMKDFLRMSEAAIFDWLCANRTRVSSDMNVIRCVATLVQLIVFKFCIERVNLVQEVLEALVALSLALKLQ